MLPPIRRIPNRGITPGGPPGCKLPATFPSPGADGSTSSRQ